MGRPRKQGKEWDRDQSDSYANWHGYGWQLWKGAYSPRQKANNVSQLRYDQMEIGEPKGQAALPASEEEPGPSGHLVKDVQKALTTARKADQRVRRLRQELTQRREQWSVYARRMKQTFTQQEAQYHADLKRLEGELAEATAAGQEAAAAMQDIVVNGAKPAPALPTSSTWDDMMREAPGMELEGPGFLAEAMATARRLGSAPQWHRSRLRLRMLSCSRRCCRLIDKEMRIFQRRFRLLRWLLLLRQAWGTLCLDLSACRPAGPVHGVSFLPASGRIPFRTCEHLYAHALPQQDKTPPLWRCRHSRRPGTGRPFACPSCRGGGCWSWAGVSADTDSSAQADALKAFGRPVFPPGRNLLATAQIEEDDDDDPDESPGTGRPPGDKPLAF